MTEKMLNHCLLLHVHKDLADSINLLELAKGIYQIRCNGRAQKPFWFISNVNYFYVDEMFNMVIIKYTYKLSTKC